MTIDNKIRDKKLRYDINREVEKTSGLSSGNIDKHEYLTGEEILRYDQRRMIEQAKFPYSPSGGPLGKQTNMLKDQYNKQIKAIEDHGKQLVQSNELI